MRSSLRLDLQPGFYFISALMVLLIPLQWCAAFMLAALFHELCHLAAVRLCGGSASLLRAGNSGATIDAWGLSSGKALLCTLAGPLGSLLLLFFSRWFPRLALCAVGQTCFNLLPLRGLDGGQALRHCFFWLFPRQIGDKLCRFIHRVALLACFVTGIYATFVLKLGILPVLFSSVLILKYPYGKIPCK